jgi:quercetin dioxygenase-like cupin family protein
MATQTANRELPKTTTYSVANASIKAERLGALEGQPDTPSGATVKPLIVGNDMLLLEIFQQKGLRVPKHQHDDHESVIYLVKGRMWLWIDGKEFTAGAGDSWIHPQGVPHYSEALEDCVAIEVKSPPRKTWTAI